MQRRLTQLHAYLQTVPYRQGASHPWTRHRASQSKVFSGLTPVSLAHPELHVPHLRSEITENTLCSGLWKWRAIWVSKIAEVHYCFNLPCLVWNWFTFLISWCIIIRCPWQVPSILFLPSVFLSSLLLTFYLPSTSPSILTCYMCFCLYVCLQNE